jgi:hypothetical protein
MNKLLKLAIPIFILNLIWEFAHHSLYIDKSGIPLYPHLIIASFIDLAFIIIIFTWVGLSHKSSNWTEKPIKKDYLVLIFLTLFVAAINEYLNLKLGRWSYTPSMPTIFGIGLSPLIQLTVTSILSLLIIRKIK